LGWVGVGEEMLDGGLFDEIDFFDCVLMHELFNDFPEEGEGGWYSDDVGYFHSVSVGVGEEGDGGFEGGDEGHDVVVAHVDYGVPGLGLAGEEEVVKDHFEEEFLALEEDGFGEFQFDHFVDVEDEDWTVVGISAGDVEDALFLC
jgi:hypothetical protein